MSSTAGRHTLTTHHRRAFGHDSDEEDAHPSHRRSGQGHQNGGRDERELLSGYSSRGAERRLPAAPSAGPRVIPVASGSDWREDRKKRLGLGKEGNQIVGSMSQRQQQQQQSVTATSGPDKINDGQQKVGLQLPSQRANSATEEVGESRPRTQAEEAEEMARLMSETASHSRPNGDATPPAEQVGNLSTPSPSQAEKDHLLTDDERARHALLTGQYGSGSSSLNAGRTILMQSAGAMDEDEAFRQDASTRPDAPTLEDYAATPIEEFGKALLRGMGWKEGMGAGKGGKGPTAPSEVKKRSALLGLGATERPSALGAERGGGSSSSSSSTRGMAKNGTGPSQTRRNDPKGQYKPLVRKDLKRSRESSSASTSSPRNRSCSPPSRHSDREDDVPRSRSSRYDDSHRAHHSESRRREDRNSSERYDRGEGRRDRHSSGRSRDRYRGDDDNEKDHRQRSRREDERRERQDGRDRQYESGRRQDYERDRHRDRIRGPDSSRRRRDDES